MGRRAWIIRGVVYPGIVVGLIGALRWFERASLFPAPGVPAEWLAQQARIVGAVATTRTAEDGVALYAWHVPGDGRRVVIWFDGNATTIGARPLEFRELHALGVDIVQVSYHGYPGSGGEPSEATLRMDARAAWDFADEVVPGAPKVLYGKSLGGGVAIGLAAEREVAGLVTESTFASATRVAKEAYPFLPVAVLMVNRFDSVALAAKVRAPTLLLHGEADDLIPVDHVEALAAAFPTRPRVIRIPGGGHNDALLMDQRAWPAVRAVFTGE